MGYIWKSTFISYISWLIVNEATVVMHAVLEHLVLALVQENTLRHILFYFSDQLIKFAVALLLLLRWDFG